MNLTPCTKISHTEWSWTTAYLKLPIPVQWRALKSFQHSYLSAGLTDTQPPKYAFPLKMLPRWETKGLVEMWGPVRKEQSSRASPESQQPSRTSQHSHIPRSVPPQGDIPVAPAQSFQQGHHTPQGAMWDLEAGDGPEATTSPCVTWNCYYEGRGCNFPWT